MYKSSRSSKSKSKSSGGGGGGGGGGGSGWSGWIWSPEYQKYYMFRMKKNGETEYHWQEAQIAPQQHAETIPREQPGVEEITNGIDNLSTSPPTNDSSYSYAPPDEESVDASYMYPTSTASYGKSRKGKEAAYEPEPHDGGETPPEEPSPAPPLDPFWGAGPDTPQGYAQDPTAHQDQDFPPPQHNTEGLYHEHEEYTSTHDLAATAYSQDSGYGTADVDDDEHDPVIHEALLDRKEMFGSESQGGSSTEPAYGTYADYEEDEGMRTPTGRRSPEPSHASSHAVSDHISGTYGATENLDSRYMVEPSHKFRPGSIFKVLWSEPSGTHATGSSTVSGKEQILGPFGEPVFIGFRRFIVIGNDEGHCTCVPILTYGGKGCNKRGVKPNKHGMIYHSKPHRPLRDEPKLGFAPVRAKINIEGEKLAKESRVNYAKLVTVEHNVKVFFIGYIPPEAFEDVEDAVDECWNKKQRSKRRTRH